MGLHWAWANGIVGSTDEHNAAGWHFPSFTQPDWTGSPMPRHPEVGSGGMTTCARAYIGNSWVGLPFPNGPLSDGQIQVHHRHSANNNGIRPIRLYAADGTTLLLEIRYNSGVLDVYSGEGTMTLRGSTTGTILVNTWHVLAVRFKTGTTGGEIAVSIDGVVETIVSNGNTGVTSDWARMGVGGAGLYVYTTGITVWDDGANDDALTVTRWVGTLRAVGDSVDGAWLNQSGSATDLYLSTRTSPMVPGTTYCVTTTDPDEARFTFDALDATYGFGSSWYPDAVDGVILTAGMQATDNAIGTGKPVIDDGSNNRPGSGVAIADNNTVKVAELFTTQADASSGWTRAALSNHTYGVRAE